MSISAGDITDIIEELGNEFNMTREEVDSFISAEMVHSTSAMRSTGMSRQNLAPADLRGKICKIPVSFSGKLTGQQQGNLRRLYPEFEITFRNDKVQAHAAAACARMLDREVLKKRAPAGFSLVSVGGNYEHELMSSDILVHSCTPAHHLVNDPKEAAREVQRMSRIRALAKGKGCTEVVAARAKRFIEDGDKSAWRCKNLAQDCTYRAGIVMMSHVYDMTLEQVAQTMVSHDARVVFGCILYTNDMLLQPEGRLPTVDGYYRIQGKRISFGFERESQWEYSHDWPQLRRYAFGGTTIRCGDRQAYYSITELRGDTLYFTMAMAPRPVAITTPVKSWRVDDRKRAVVRSFKLSDTDRTSERRALVPCSYVYPYDPFVKCLSYAVERMEKGSFSLEDLQRKVRAIFADTTINSVRVAGFERLDDEQMAYFLSNIGILASVAVNTSSVGEGALLDGVRARRTALEQGSFAKAGAAIKSFFGQPFPNGSRVQDSWRGLVTFFTSCEDAVLSQVSWKMDMGYRYAAGDGSSVDGPGVDADSAGDETPGVPGADHYSDFLYAKPTDEETQALLVSAANDSDEFALALAETAAAVNNDPLVAKFATALRAKFDVSVDSAAREADRVYRERCLDPDALFRDASRTAVDTVGGVGTSDSDLVVPAAGQSDQRHPALVAAQMGITLDPADEVELTPHPLAVVEDVANCAILEAVALIRAAEDRLLGECRTNHEQVCIQGNPEGGKLRRNSKLNYEPDFWMPEASGKLALVSFTGRRVDPKERFFPFAAVYVPEEQIIVRVKTVCNSDGTYDHYVIGDGEKPVSTCVMTTTQLVIYNGPVIISNMLAALQKPLPKDFSLAFIEGVPGCGKTHYIIHNVPEDGVVVACGRENADTTRSRIVAHCKENADVPQFKQPIRGVRTLDSALMAPTSGRKGTMFLDECFQDHSGKFWAVIKLWQAHSVQALGDSQQIPYVDRCNTGLCTMAKMSHWSIRIGKYLTRRCPRDAVMAISGFYDRKIRTTSLVSSSMVLENSVTNVPLDPAWKYLTMYQDDKQTLLAKGYPAVNTVAEVQGQTYPKVALVRIQERDMPLFSKPEYVDVALSRHTHQFVYYSPDRRADMITQLVEEANKNLSMVDKYGDVSTVGVDIFDV